MQVDATPSRSGFLRALSEPRQAWRLLLALLAVYALFFALFYPAAITNDDEAAFIRQAEMLADGKLVVSVIDPLTDGQVDWRPGGYAPGTSLLAAPFVWLAGWRGSFLVPCLSLLAAVLLTARWLHDEDRSPLFALLVLGFPPALVMGRVVMTDVPSAAVAALGLWLFWRGLDRGPRWWLASGFVAGASLLVRPTNPLLFLPLFAGSVLRRERKAWALVVGGLAGVLLRLLVMQLFYMDPLFERSGFRPDPGRLVEHLLLFGFGLLVFVPGGLVLALAYRGRRRPEIVCTVALFFLFFTLQTFSTVAASLQTRLVLALRYLIPVVPLVAFAMAESTPRLWAALLARSAARPRLERLATLLLAVWLGGIALGAGAVHVGFARWSSTHAAIQAAILEHVPDDVVVVINWRATKRFIPLQRTFLPVDRGKVGKAELSAILRPP